MREDLLGTPDLSLPQGTSLIPVNARVYERIAYRGGTEGIVTLEDIIGELVGEIWDEHDEVEVDIEKTGDNTYVADGMMNLDDLFKFFKIEDKKTDVTTVNGWVMEKTDKIPETGDNFDYENLHLEVTETDGRRAAKVKITVAANDSEKEE